MKRFIITVLIATVLHAVALIIAPPFEFGHSRTQNLISGIVSGLVGFPAMFTIVLLPLRWTLRRLMPRMLYAKAVAAGSVLLCLATARVFTHPTFPFQHGFYCHWSFWSTVAIAVTVSFFWPFGTQTGPNPTLQPTPTAP